MYFTDDEFTSIYEVKKSKFISTITPYVDFHNKYNKLKLEHPKARHIVYAYRYLNEYNQIVENSSDDGEPKGCAGKPTLKVLQGNDIVNSIIFTVRYFGGIKLGTGGMIRAYSSAVKEALSIATLKPYIVEINTKIESSYTNLSKLKYNLKINNITIINQEFLNDKIILHIKGTKENLAILTIDLH